MNPILLPWAAGCWPVLFFWSSVFCSLQQSCDTTQPSCFGRSLCSILGAKLGGDVCELLCDSIHLSPRSGDSVNVASWAARQLCWLDSCNLLSCALIKSWSQTWKVWSCLLDGHHKIQKPKITSRFWGVWRIFWVAGNDTNKQRNKLTNKHICIQTQAYDIYSQKCA